MEIPDQFVVCGDIYNAFSAAIAQLRMKPDCKSIVDIFKQQTDFGKRQKESLFHLAIYREITMNSVQSLEQKTTAYQELINRLEAFINGTDYVQEKELAKELIHNTQWGRPCVMRVLPNQSVLDRRLAMIVMHMRIVLCCCHRNPLLGPLITLMENPGQMSCSYLPTMKDDILLEFRNVIENAGQNLVFYGIIEEVFLLFAECPNGHSYAIGECGKPWRTGVCSVKGCGETIGGRLHEAATGNKRTSRDISSKVGHILGAPDARTHEQPGPERRMGPAATAVMRLLLHAVMVAADVHDSQKLQELINPKVTTDVIEFLWQHLHCDIKLIARATGTSGDDAAVLIHIIIHSILSKITEGCQQVFNTLLNTPKCRENWEDEFTQTYINPVLMSRTTQLKKANTLMHDEHDRLHRIIHELDGPGNYNNMALINIPNIWRYRVRVTIDHLALTLEDNNTTGKAQERDILHMFLKKEPKLRGLIYLPEIIQLQHLLIEQFHRRIDVNEANEMNIQEFLDRLQEGHLKDNYIKLITSFSKAWELTKCHLHNYRLPVDFGGKQVPAELCDISIDMSTSIAVLLPTRKSNGVCSTALADFLITTQNEFIDMYLSKRGRKLHSDEEIRPSDLTPAHLIAYDPDKDLLPLVLSHCNYSLEVGKGSVIEYDLDTLERQLEERFIIGKAKIERKTEQLLFRQDSRDAAVFETIKQKIPQEKLTKAAKHHILSELRLLTDVWDSITCLDILIGFVVSSGGNPNMPINTYLQNILRMEKDVMKVRHPCQLKHVLALWELLNIERAKRLTMNDQDPFDTLEKEYRVQLEENQIAKLHAALQYINSEQLINVLHNYIALGLQEQIDACGDITEWRIHDVFQNIENVGVITGFEDNFPKDILIKNLFFTWNEIIKYCHKN
ncbi:E3 ubiquitin-protein ligase rnf213-alpha-like [Saccoglossus kowalevskii]